MKKGFTLIEMLGVVAIVALLVTIILPIYNTVINEQKEKLYSQVINDLYKTMDEYILIENINDDNIEVSISELYSNNYLDKIPINPITDEELEGCIIAEYINNQYNYSFDSCSN